MPLLRRASPIAAACLSTLGAPAAQGTLVKDINPGGTPSHPALFTALREKVVFRAIHTDLGSELWVSDGTEPGTFLLQDILPGGDESAPHDFIAFQDRVFFLAHDPEGIGLWATNGTAFGTVKIRHLEPFVGGDAGPMAVAGDLLFFASGLNLWRSDGTPEGTVVVTGIGPTLTGFEMHGYQGEVYLSKSFVPVGADELWKSDGTAAGTVLVKEILPGPQGSYPRGFKVAGDYLFFKADGADGEEVWRTDGTEAGTIQVANVHPTAGSNPEDLVALDNGILLWSATPASLTREIWKSDGTPAGTSVLYTPPFLSSNALGLVSFGDEAWFLVPWFFEPPELWSTDGTPAGTHGLVKGEWFGAPMTAIGSGKLVVWAGQNPGVGSLGYEPYVTDGTLHGTALVDDVSPPGTVLVPGGYTRAGNKVFFYAEDGPHGVELHAFDLDAFGGWLAEPFGTGCGAGGGPALSIAGVLKSGLAVSLELAHAPPAAPVLAYISAISTADDFGACMNYLAAPLPFLSAGTDGAGTLSLPLLVPAEPALQGLPVMLQTATVVPGGPFLGLAELSNAVELVIGG